MKNLTGERVLNMVRDEIQKDRSQKAYARRVGISESYLSDVLSKRRDISPKILKALGLKRIVMYQENSNDSRN